MKEKTDSKGRILHTERANEQTENTYTNIGRIWNTKYVDVGD